ncbi:hypothetical protein K435DRAFT_670898, partial [Dendrothele bispora CBS 962.96]
ITQDEITARSKTDSLTKSIAVVQTTWFILQCIARVNEGLVITDLEIVTVAFALLNTATYILWWNKPVRYPVKIDYCRKHSKSKITVKEDRDVDLVDVILSIPLASSITQPSGGEDSYHTGLESTPPSLYPTAISLFFVLGVIHCAPWNFTFPTHMEQVLWRISAVTVTAFPLVWFLLFKVILSLGGSTSESQTAINPIASITFILLPLVYIWVRITLIVIAFMELRALPPSAYQTVDWGRFIPHI